MSTQAFTSSLAPHGVNASGAAAVAATGLDLLTAWKFISQLGPLFVAVIQALANAFAGGAKPTAMPTAEQTAVLAAHGITHTETAIITGAGINVEQLIEWAKTFASNLPAFMSAVMTLIALFQKKPVAVA